MDDDVKQTVGCMIVIVLFLLVLAAGVLIGHFFGIAFGLATLLILIAALMFWLACAYYKSEGE